MLFLNVFILSASWAFVTAQLNSAQCSNHQQCFDYRTQNYGLYCANGNCTRMTTIVREYCVIGACYTADDCYPLPFLNECENGRCKALLNVIIPTSFAFVLIIVAANFAGFYGCRKCLKNVLRPPQLSEEIRCRGECEADVSSPYPMRHLRPRPTSTLLRSTLMSYKR